MRRLSLLLIAALSMAMGGKRPDDGAPAPAPSGAGPQAFEQSFRSLAANYGAVLVGKTIAFSFRTFFGSTIGMCQMNGSGNNSVQLSSSAWSRNSDTFREMLVFHELGHCLLGRGHKNTSHSDGRKESIMNSYIFDSKTYLAHRDAYLKELFTVVRDTAFAFSSGPSRERKRVFDDCQFGK